VAAVQVSESPGAAAAAASTGAAASERVQPRVHVRYGPHQCHDGPDGQSNSNSLRSPDSEVRRRPGSGCGAIPRVSMFTKLRFDESKRTIDAMAANALTIGDLPPGT
jgi:hypothetical protein